MLPQQQAIVVGKLVLVDVCTAMPTSSCGEFGRSKDVLRTGDVWLEWAHVNLNSGISNDRGGLCRAKGG